MSFGDEKVQLGNEAPSLDRAKAKAVYIFLDQSFKAALLQISRIEKERQAVDVRLLPALFADIHFFLVAVSNILKILIKLRSMNKSDQELHKIFKHHIAALEHLDNFRDHLEHITDGRIDGMGKRGVPLKSPGMLGNLFGDEYDFGGEKFSIPKAFSTINELYNSIKEWNARIQLYSHQDR